MAHDSTKSTAKRLFKVQDLANSGKEWRSPAFDLLDPNHPAVTGRRHPNAVQGAGSGDKKTSAVAAARGETSQTTPQSGQNKSGYNNSGHQQTGGVNTAQPLQGGVPASNYSTQAGNLGGGYATGYASQGVTDSQGYASQGATAGQGYRAQGTSAAQGYQQGVHDTLSREEAKFSQMRQ